MLNSKKNKLMALTTIMVGLISLMIIMGILVGTAKAESKNSYDTDQNLIDQATQHYYGTKTRSIINISYQKDLYDFNNNILFTLVQYDTNGYLIINNLTGTVFERCETGVSPYEAYKNEKLCYAGYNLYFIERGSNYTNILTLKTINHDNTLMFQENIDEIIIRDISENKARFAIQDRWGKNDKFSTALAKEYFSNTLRMTNVSNYSDYLVHGSKGYDLKFPKNTGSSCGIVALTMMLQYYDINDLGVKIPSEFYADRNISYSNYIPLHPVVKNSRMSNAGNDETYQASFEAFEAYHLHGVIDNITPAGALGENLAPNLKTGLSNFYDNYGSSSNKITLKANGLYDNLMGCIDRGKLAVGITGTTGNGYYQDGAWQQVGVALHGMLVYGYCTTNSGTLKDFICHSGWRTNNSSKVYVYKMNFFQNATME